MLYVIGCLLILSALAAIFKTAAVPSAWSKTALLAVIMSVVANVALVDTVAYNAYPELNDGIGIPNSIAYWIIGEDRWSIERFQAVLNLSVWCTIAAALLFAFVTIWEAIRKQRAVT